MKLIFFIKRMSITLSHEMFNSLSKSSRDEILQVFANTSIVAVEKIKDILETTQGVSAFESAALTFGKPLKLPNYNRVANEEAPKSVRVAVSCPIAKSTDRYSLAPLADLGRICKEIDEGLFISNYKSIKWSKGSKFHHMDWDVKKVVMEVKYLQPATSLQIDQSLPTMDRYRVTSILRELRKQGILVVT